MKNKMQWKESVLPCYEGGHAFENDLFRVVHYSFSGNGGIMIRKNHWRAYRKSTGEYVGGKCVEFTTKDDAIKATEGWVEAGND